MFNYLKNRINSNKKKWANYVVELLTIVYKFRYTAEKN